MISPHSYIPPPCPTQRLRQSPTQTQNQETPEWDALLDTVPANQRSIRANFQSLVVGDHYFRSVVIDGRTGDLVDLQSQIVKTLGRSGLGYGAPRFL
ncbi:hypothetical protein PAXRUDRAFT_359525 [Paxillus rubicundulus Ve08.2h10]|uniref:Uncharacterized protein n=1 Tax=Paxillus rubicundulus Ve08.2h10 TaxID=930991 RepID=A0A0D0DPH5_9AGAM|nr:hypothetical protein PAXRUDRAFT_359525 [Paxillus rubicundulus Ve08.2h10]